MLCKEMYQRFSFVETRGSHLRKPVRNGPIITKLFNDYTHQDRLSTPCCEGELTTSLHTNMLCVSV